MALWSAALIGQPARLAALTPSSMDTSTGIAAKAAFGKHTITGHETGPFDDSDSYSISGDQIEV